MAQEKLSARATVMLSQDEKNDLRLVASSGNETESDLIRRLILPAIAEQADAIREAIRRAA